MAIAMLFSIYYPGKAQIQPTANIPFLGDQELTIDGLTDAVWEQVSSTTIDKPFYNETPTLNSATWKALWNNKGIYVLVEVSDDEWLPSWKTNSEDWLSDKPELYFDVTTPQKDGGGAINGNGNYQIAPNFSQDNPGSLKIYTQNSFLESDSVLYAESYDTLGNYSMEYFVPFSALKDNNGTITSPETLPTIGFDVTIIDSDEPGSNVRNRTVWANAGPQESWFGMDDVGLITFIKDTLSNLQVKFTVSDTVVTQGDFVQFINLSSGSSLTYLWDFGDSITSTQRDPWHSYTKEGSYTVSLTVSDADSSITETVVDYITVIKSNIPIVDFKADTTVVKINTEISFTDLSQNNPTGWLWNFGDTLTSNEQNPKHSYALPGIYTVKLVASNNGGRDSLTKSNYITVEGLAPKTDFKADITDTKTDSVIKFTDFSENDPTNWAWDFGDGTSSDLQNPSHVYTQAGTYSVSLTTSNDWGSDIETKTDYIIVNSVEEVNMRNANIVSIFPNPTSGIVNIRIGEDNSNNKITIIDFSGKLVLEINNPANSIQTVDMSGYSKGIYWVKISDNKLTSVRKMILQ